MRQLVVAACAVGAAGHGYLTSPPPRAASLIKGDIAGSAGSCATGICFWFSQGCTIGCPKCGGSDGDAYCGRYAPELATLPAAARTNAYQAVNYTKQPCHGCAMHKTEQCGVNPWCAPGNAPIMNPCGVAGGDGTEGKPGNGGDPPVGHKQGEDGRLLPELAVKTTWKAGGSANISWAVIANHGGGYQYRLCEKSAQPTEACFQQTPLGFASSEQYIQYCISTVQYPPYNSQPGAFPSCGVDDSITGATPPTQTIPATDVATGTIPAGSTWRRNPIPGCRSPNAGAFGESCGPTNGTSPDDFQFPPAGPDLSRPGQLLGGFGAGGCYGAPYGAGCGQPPYGSQTDKLWNHMFHFNIVDTVSVPKVPPGEYILSFRWDCEQTPQIWSTCSDVSIE